MKKFLVALAAMGFAGLAQASYLYWQVADAAVSKYEAEGVRVLWGETFESATAQDIVSVDGTSLGSVISGTDAVGSKYLVDISEISNGAFYIELVKWENSSWSAVGYSESVAYQDVGAYTIELSGIHTVIPSAWTGGAYAAPEPTSAMLMLLGMAGLALKRRKA